MTSAKGQVIEPIPAGIVPGPASDSIDGRQEPIAPKPVAAPPAQAEPAPPKAPPPPKTPSATKAEPKAPPAPKAEPAPKTEPGPKTAPQSDAPPPPSASPPAPAAKPAAKEQAEKPAAAAADAKSKRPIGFRHLVRITSLELNALAMDLTAVLCDTKTHGQTAKRYDSGERDAFFELLNKQLDTLGPEGTLETLNKRGSAELLQSYAEKFERLLDESKRIDSSGALGRSLATMAIGRLHEKLAGVRQASESNGAAAKGS